MTDDLMEDFTREVFTSGEFTYDVYWSGSGPAVIVMAEMPGITPNVLRFARWVRDLGCTVVLPDLFGRAGFDSTWPSIGKVRGIAYGAKVLTSTCVRKEFVCWATGRSSPVVTWLRALGREAHERCGGPGIGAVGMCFTGGFALAMATDDRLLVPVLSQPANPFGFTKKQRETIDISLAELERVQERCVEGLEVVGLRFTGDRLVPKERFRPRDLAFATAPVRLSTSSLVKMCTKCDLTVASEMCSCAAIARLLNPSATQIKTSSSLPLNFWCCAPRDRAARRASCGSSTSRPAAAPVTASTMISGSASLSR